MKFDYDLGFEKQERYFSFDSSYENLPGPDLAVLEVYEKGGERKYISL